MSASIAHAALAIAAAVFDGLWQGALIAGAVWLGLRALPQLGAATRYAIWLCALAALVLIPVFTAGVTVRAGEPAADASAAVPQSAVLLSPDVQPGKDRVRVAPEPAGAAADPVPAAPRKPQITIPQSLGIAVASIWLLVVCARGLLLLLDLRALAAVRRDARLWPSRHEYPVLISERVHVPIAAGFLRPVIVLPAALVEKLLARDVEAIVIHEIAHLRRYDVWTNAVARIAEALAALNPAAWFVMRRLAIEREIACDDWVVARSGAGESFARTLAAMASSAGARPPLAAPSAIGSRHSIVVRIERLLDARPRRLRLSPSALAGAVMLLALIAFVVQSVSPVLAYEPQPALLAQAPTTAPAGGTCAVPNRGIAMAYLMGPQRRRTGSPPDNVELMDASKIIARVGASRAATFDLTVDAAGKPRKVVVLTPERYPGMAENITRIYMESTYEPALRNCVPVTATIRTAMPINAPELVTTAVIDPVYPAGWSARNKTSCKVPTVTHARYRSGFALPTKYGAMLPAFPPSMRDVAVGIPFETSVRVHVDGAAATSATLAGSSGRKVFDDAALAAARQATYPLIDSTCRPLPSDYVWHTTFLRQLPMFGTLRAQRRAHA